MNREEALASIGKRVVYHSVGQPDRLGLLIKAWVDTADVVCDDGVGTIILVPTQALTLEEQPAPALSYVLGDDLLGYSRKITPASDAFGILEEQPATETITTPIMCAECKLGYTASNKQDLIEERGKHIQSEGHKRGVAIRDLRESLPLVSTHTPTRTEIRENIETLSEIIREIGGENFPVTIPRELWLALGNEFVTQSEAFLATLKEGR